VVVCPYHAWTYELTGRLRAAPNTQAVPGFDKSQICLTEVRTEVFLGFVFVNLDPTQRRWTTGSRARGPNWRRSCPIGPI
jgi:phenylpropionate dioxygenase-like ring-hydroxylating dioxygenase large terminal subunit